MRNRDIEMSRLKKIRDWIDVRQKAERMNAGRYYVLASRRGAGMRRDDCPRKNSMEEGRRRHLLW
jgi:hypothetical protein